MTFPSSAPQPFHESGGPPGPYAVRVRSARWMLELPLAAVSGAAWYLFATRVVEGSAFFGLLGVAIVGYGVFRAVRPVPVLKVGPDGFRLGGAGVPWTSVREVVIGLPAVEAGPSPAVEVGLRLRHGAPLPDGMDAVVHDPRDAKATQLSRSFGPGRVDPGALAAATAAFGRVPVVESRAGTERRIG